MKPVVWVQTLERSLLASPVFPGRKGLRRMAARKASEGCRGSGDAQSPPPECVRRRAGRAAAWLRAAVRSMAWGMMMVPFRVLPALVTPSRKMGAGKEMPSGFPCADSYGHLRFAPRPLVWLSSVRLHIAGGRRRGWLRPSPHPAARPTKGEQEESSGCFPPGGSGLLMFFGSMLMFIFILLHRRV